MINYKKYKTYIFDLDNTLYNEVDYLYPALFSIARDLDNQYGSGYLNVCAFLKNTFIREGRKELFDKLIIHFDFPPEIIDLCLNKLRTIIIEEKINLKEDMQQYLEHLIPSGKKYLCLPMEIFSNKKTK